MEPKYSIDSYIDFPLLMRETVDDRLDINRKNWRSNKSKKYVKYCFVKNKIIELDIDYNLKSKIEEMPIDVQKKLCIYAWRMFWRDYVPLTAKVPLWYTHKLYVEKTLFESREKNIHFLHLEFNTLPENKKWIMGCQCEYCQNYEYENELECHLAYNEEYDKGEKYLTTVPNSTVSNWNAKLYWITNDLDAEPMAGYDPLYGSEFEDFIKWATRKNIQINFSENLY